MPFEGTIDSELFGHEGLLAQQAHAKRILEVADGGTIF
jgi:transcriptional regulator of aromatic amino acid metabolism